MEVFNDPKNMFFYQKIMENKIQKSKINKNKFKNRYSVSKYGF